MLGHLVSHISCISLQTSVGTQTSFKHILSLCALSKLSHTFLCCCSTVNCSKNLMQVFHIYFLNHFTFRLFTTAFGLDSFSFHFTNASALHLSVLGHGMSKPLQHHLNQLPQTQPPQPKSLLLYFIAASSNPLKLFTTMGHSFLQMSFLIKNVSLVRLSPILVTAIFILLSFQISHKGALKLPCLLITSYFVYLTSFLCH